MLRLNLTSSSFSSFLSYYNSKQVPIEGGEQAVVYSAKGLEISVFNFYSLEQERYSFVVPSDVGFSDAVTSQQLSGAKAVVRHYKSKILLFYLLSSAAKAKLAELSGIPVEQQRIYYEGSV